MTSHVPSYHGYRFSPEIISHAIWLYQRFGLSFRDVEDLLAQRDITVTYETIRQWCERFGPVYARRLRHAAVGWVTPGIWTNCSSRFKVANSICGAPWTKTATSSTSSCNRDGIGAQPPDSSGSSSRARGMSHVG